MKMRQYIVLGFLLLAAYFPLFLHLDSEPLFHWDESRNAINAFEMIQHGNPLIRTYNGEPDSWELKPPMLIWCQVISMKLVGFNELGVRLPTALAGLFTLILIFHFLVKELNDWPGAAFAVLTLLCTSGYIDFHVARTGDHDTLLVLFQLVTVLYIFKYLKSSGKRPYFFLTVTGIILGVLTKSIMGLALLSGILIYILIKKQLGWLLSRNEFWVGIFTFLITIGAYYLGREHYQPGYLQLVWEGELLPRFTGTSEGHNFNKPDTKWYYLKLIFTQQFRWFSWILPVLIFLVLKNGNKAQKEFAIYILIVAGTFLIFISFGTVNPWYDAALFPLMAILCGLGFSVLLQSIQSKLKGSLEWKSSIIPILFTLLIFSIPYSQIIKKVYMPKANLDLYGTFFKVLEKEEKPKDLFVFYKWRNSSYLFYEKVYTQTKNWNIESCGYQGKFERCSIAPKPTQQIMICSNEIRRAFEKEFDYKILRTMDRCRLYSLIEE